MAAVTWGGSQSDVVPADNVVGATAGVSGLVVAVVTTVIMIQALVLVGLECRARRRGHASVLGPSRTLDPQPSASDLPAGARPDSPTPA